MKLYDYRNSLHPRIKIFCLVLLNIILGWKSASGYESDRYCAVVAGAQYYNDVSLVDSYFYR